MSCSCLGLCPLNTMSSKVSFSRRTRFWSRRLLEKSTNLSKNTVLATRTHMRHCIQLSSIQYKNKQSFRFVLCSSDHIGTVLFSEVKSEHLKARPTLKINGWSLAHRHSELWHDSRAWLADNTNEFWSRLQTKTLTNRSDLRLCSNWPSNTLSCFYLKAQTGRAPTKPC